MLLFWRIRYLDSRDKQFKDRDLWLDTGTLDAVSKAAVEANYALHNSDRRAILRYRHLFQEGRPDTKSLACGGGFCVSDYFEDEAGQELTYQRMAVVLTGNPQATFFPPGTRPHDAEYYRWVSQLGLINMNMRVHMRAWTRWAPALPWEATVLAVVSWAQGVCRWPAKPHTSSSPL